MTTTLSIYQNCSLGGVVAVMRERARRDAPAGHGHDMYFFGDQGGRPSLLAAGVRRVVVGRNSHDANILALAQECRPDVATLFSHYRVGRMLRPMGVEVRAEVHGSHVSAVDALRSAEGAYDRIVVPSAWSKAWLASHGFAQDLIDIVPNTIDPSVFRLAERPRSGPARPSPERPAPVIWVGRVEEHKNWRDALTLFATLIRRGLPIHPVMILSLYSDTDRIHAFMRQVGYLGLLNRLELLFNLPQEEVAEELRNASQRGGCLISTSKLESFGLSILESQKCGLPVVAPRVGAIPEVLHEGNGVLYAFGDVEAAADLVERVVFDARQRATLDAFLLSAAGRTTSACA
jgi:glycosyltransferase involved in cell wall biosynthesis